MLSQIAAEFFRIVYIILLITIFLTWIPSIDWYKEPFKSLKNFMDIFLAPFRKIIPPLGGIDFSPIIAFIVLELAGNFIVALLRTFNL